MSGTNARLIQRRLNIHIILPLDSDGSSMVRLQKMEVVEAWRGRNLSRRRGFSLQLFLSPVILFLSTFRFIFLKKSGISTSLLSQSP